MNKENSEQYDAGGSKSVKENYPEGSSVKAVAKKIDFKAEDLLQREPIELDTESISAQIEDKIVLITGAAGSIGSEIVRQVLNFKPRTVIMLDQAETPLYFLDMELAPKKESIEIIPVLCSVTNKTALKAVFKKYMPNVVYHAAAYKHVPLLEGNPIEALVTNILGTKNVADLLCKTGKGTFVMISTDKAVNPGSIMGASKLISEKYIHALNLSLLSNNVAGIKFITTRFGNVLGSNGSVVPVFAKQIENGGPITLTHPDITRYFMTIKEACQLVLEAGAMGKGGEIFIFDMGKQVKISDLALKMIHIAGADPADIKIEIVGLRPGEKMSEELLSSQSTLLSTHNSNIMVVQEQADNNAEIIISVKKLVKLALKYKIDKSFEKIKEMIPDFAGFN